ncbi:MAG: TolC family protein [Candidatus Cloacimonetes bacterium]|nr:TolC family protein [Candidatus Cloacimonadota bacterium]
MNFLQISDVMDLVDISRDQHRIFLEKFQTLNSEEIEDLNKKIIQIGRENNPALKMSSLTIETNKKSLIMAGGTFLPNISLSYSKNWRKYNIDNEFDASGQLELNLTLPIFPLLDTGFGVAKAKYDLRQSGYNFESAENNLDLTLKSAVLNLVTAAKTVHSSRLALEYASETYTQMQERFSSNMITSNEFLSAEIMFISAQNQNVSGFYDFLKAKSSLLQQMGLEDEKKLYQLIP